MKATNTAATTAAVANRIVTIASMINSTYTIANASPVWSGGALITITHATVAAGTDTLGTITIVGKDLSGNALSEVITPLADTVATGTKIFRSVTSATGAGWIIAGGNDTVTIGVAAGSYVSGSSGRLGGVLVNNTVATLFTVSDATGVLITVPASQAAGTYYNLQGVDYSGFLKVTTTSTNDVTVYHTQNQPLTYAMA
jgi:hypothetical protein